MFFRFSLSIPIVTTIIENEGREDYLARRTSIFIALEKVQPMQRHSSTGAGAYLIGPAIPNPTALFSYTVASPGESAHAKQQAFPEDQDMPELSDEAVSAAIERLTRTPGNDPVALHQAALDMELVIRHFDSLSEAFGPEAALTSLALDMAETSKKARQAETKRPASRARRYSKN
jgi:hypothetical protein